METVCDGSKGCVGEGSAGSARNGERTREQLALEIAALDSNAIDVATLTGGLAAALVGDTGAAAGGTAAENNAFWIPAVIIIAAILETADKVLVAKDAVDISVAVYACNGGDMAACGQAEDMAKQAALDAGIEFTIGGIIPGSKAAADLLRWTRKNADADTVRRIDRVANRGAIPDDLRPVSGVGAQVNTPRGFSTYRTSDGDLVHVSPGGLRYGADPKFGNRVDHVLNHTAPNPNKPVHSVFNAQGGDALDLVDQAWVRRGAPDPSDPAAFVVGMGRPIGTAGETSIRIVVRPGTTEVITAYPY